VIRSPAAPEGLQGLESSVAVDLDPEVDDGSSRKSSKSMKSI
jgi:hypothetical protein